MWNGVSYGIQHIASYVAFYYFTGGVVGEVMRYYGAPVASFSVSALVKELIVGAIYGALGGFVLSKFYTQISDINKRYLGTKLNTFFKLLLYPTVIAAIVLSFLGGILSNITGVMPFIITIAGMVGARYLYAYMMNKKVGIQYPNP